MTTDSILSKITEAFAAKGYTGEELTEKVLAAGLLMAVALDAKDAADHFRARLSVILESR